MDLETWVSVSRPGILLADIHLLPSWPQFGHRPDALLTWVLWGPVGFHAHLCCPTAQCFPESPKAPPLLGNQNPDPRAQEARD